MCAPEMKSQRNGNGITNMGSKFEMQPGIENSCLKEREIVDGSMHTI